MEELILPKLLPAIMKIPQEYLIYYRDKLIQIGYKELQLEGFYDRVYIQSENKETLFNKKICYDLDGAKIQMGENIYLVHKLKYGDVVLEDMTNNINIALDNQHVYKGIILEFHYNTIDITAEPILQGGNFSPLLGSSAIDIHEIPKCSIRNIFNTVNKGIFVSNSLNLLQIIDGVIYNLFTKSEFQLGNSILLDEDCYTYLVETKGEFIKPLAIDLENGNILVYKTETKKEIFFDNLLKNKVNRFKKLGLHPSRLFKVNGSGIEKYILNTLSSNNVDINTVYKQTETIKSITDIINQQQSQENDTTNIGLAFEQSLTQIETISTRSNLQSPF